MCEHGSENCFMCRTEKWVQFYFEESTTEQNVCFTVAIISSDPFVYVGGNCGRCMDL
jgi:hypothetical protein